MIYIADTLANILEFFSFTLLACSLLDHRFKINKFLLLLLIYILPDFMINTFSIHISSEVDFLLCLLILVIYFMLSYKKDFITALSIYANGYFIIATIQFAFVIADALLLHLNQETTLPIVGSIYTLIVSYLLYRFVKLNRLFSLLFETGKAGKFVIINLYIVAIIIVTYFHTNLTTYYENILFIIVAFAIIIICNMLLSNQINKIKTQELRLNAYSEYLPVLEDLINTVRIRQHNHNNQMLAIKGILYTKKDYESLVAALEEQLQLDMHSGTSNHLLKINLPLVAGFLFQKANEAEKRGRKIDFDFSTYTLVSSVPEYDLIEMFGILIDNAIEAVPVGSTVYVHVSCDGKQITFTTKNAGHILTPDERKQFFTKGYTYKDDEKTHSGLGLYQLNSLIKQYDGSSLALWNEDTDILFRIIV